MGPRRAYSTAPAGALSGPESAVRGSLGQVDDAWHEDDPFLEATVAAAVDRFEGVVPAALVAEMRASLGDGLSTHPVGATLLDRARRRAVPDQSGDQAKGDADEAPGKAGGSR